MGDKPLVVTESKPAKPEAKVDPWQAELQLQRGRLNDDLRLREMSTAKTDAGRIDLLQEKILSAIDAQNELIAHVQSIREGKSGQDRITLRDGRVITVAARCKELQDIIKRDLPDAIKLADTILVDPKDRKPGDNRTTAKEDLAEYNKGGAQSKEEIRKGLCKNFGFDTDFRNLDVEEIEAKLAEMKKNGADKQDIGDLNKLLGLHQELERINLKMRAPAVVRLLYANFISKGFLEGDPLQTPEFVSSSLLPHTDAVLKSLRTGAPLPNPDALPPIQLALLPERTANLCLRLVREASYLCPEVDLSRQIAKNSDAIQDQYLYYQLRLHDSICDLKQRADKESDPRKKEELLKEALEESKKVNMPFLVNHMEQVAARIKQLEALGHLDPERQMLYKQLCDTYKAELETINVVQGVKFSYAKLLTETDRASQALPILIKIETETPRLVRQVVNDDGTPYTEMDERRGRKAFLKFDEEFIKVKNAAMFGPGLRTQSPDGYVQELQDALERDKDMGKALTSVRAARASIAERVDKLSKAEPHIKAEKAEIEQRLRELDARTDLNQREKQIERRALTENIKELTKVLNLLADLTKKLPLFDYIEGVCEMALGNSERARFLFACASRDPEIANNKIYRLKEYQEVVKDKSWFEENWEYIKKGLLITAAVAAGAAAAALTIWLGPGSLAVGGGVFAAVMWGGAALLAGTAAGAVVYTGGKWALGDNVSWRDLVEGGGYGLTGATMVVTSGFGTALAPEATAGSGFVSTSINWTARFGATRVFPGVSTALVGNTTEKGSQWYFGKLDKEELERQLADLETRTDLDPAAKEKERERLTDKIADIKGFDGWDFLKSTGRDAFFYSLGKPLPKGATVGGVATKETFRQTVVRQGIRKPTLRVLSMDLLDPAVIPIVKQSSQQIYDYYTLPLDPNNPSNRNKIFARMPGTLKAKELLKDRESGD
jgi:hypothetical protein